MAFKGGWETTWRPKDDKASNSMKKAQMKTQMNTQLRDAIKNNAWEFEQGLPWQKVYVIMHLLKAVKAVAIQIEDQTDKDQSKSEPQNQTYINENVIKRRTQ